MNKIIITGGLGHDAELTMAKNTGKAILKFSVAVNRGFKSEDGVDWINCVIFGERAEKLAQYLLKGTKVLVEGTLRLGEYEGKDGTKKKTTDVFVNNVEMLGNKKENGNSDSAQATEYKEIEPIDDGSIPF